MPTPKKTQRSSLKSALQRDNPPKENDMELTYSNDWQTQARGTNDSEYQIYLACAGDSEGNDTFTGQPLKTYDDWLNS